MKTYNQFIIVESPETLTPKILIFAVQKPPDQLAQDRH
jgi:hypothetical protein